MAVRLVHEKLAGKLFRGNTQRNHAFTWAWHHQHMWRSDTRPYLQPALVRGLQGWVELIKVLVQDLKNKVDTADRHMFTPLHAAANGGHTDTIRRLLHFGHRVDARDNHGGRHASRRGCRCPAWGAGPRPADLTPSAESSSYLPQCGCRWEHEPCSCRCFAASMMSCMHAGRTALHYAAMHGRVGAVRELVGSGASLEVADGRGGFTALHLAADAGQCEAVAALLELGARLEAVSSKGWTPLVLATMKVSV